MLLKHLYRVIRRKLIAIILKIKKDKRSSQSPKKNRQLILALTSKLLLKRFQNKMKKHLYRRKSKLLKRLQGFELKKFKD